MKVKIRGSSSGFLMFSRMSKVFYLTVIIGVIATCNFVSSLNDSNDLIISLAEKNALDKLKSQVIKLLPEEFMKTDFYLIRWIRVAKLDVDRARNLLMQTVQWRLKNNITNILKEDWSDMELDYGMAFDGVDKEGRPIMTIDIGDWDLMAGAIRGATRRLQRYLTYANERSMHRILEEQEKGKSITRFVVLVDADGINLRQHLCPSCLAVLIHWTTNGEQHYPLFSDEVVVINAPGIISFAMNAIRPFMSASTRNQMKIFNTNRQEWMSYLENKIDRSERSQRYGGLRIFNLENNLTF